MLITIVKRMEQKHFLRIEPSPLDKVLELPKSYNTVEGGTGSRGGFYSSNINIGVTIEQIPSFQGALVTDGINDLITSTKTVQEMLGGSNEITVVSMIHQIGFISSRNYARNNYFIQGNDFLTNTIIAIGKIGIYGYKGNLSNIAIVNDILGDKKDYSVDKANPANIDSVFSVNGTHSSAQLSQLAWYWTIIANKVLTTDQINQVIAYFNLDRTLNPDILCNTIKQGITNENHAEFGDKLIDYSGNGRDIQLNNIAWKGDSGIGKYAADFTSWTTPKEVQKTSDTVKITTEYTEHWVAYLAPNNTFKSMKVLISGIPDGGALQLFRTTADGGGIKMVNGINEIPEFTNTVAAGFYIDVPLGFDWSNLVIEQIPSHAGGLCLDGVNDFGKVTGMPIYKDYTFIIDYERISYSSSEVWTTSVVSKAHTVGQGAFILMLANREVELLRQSNSFGSTTTFNRDDFTRTLLYQSKYKCGDVNLTVGGGIDGDTLWLGTLRDNDYRFFNGAIYSLMSFPYSMSEFLIERQLKKHKLGTLYPNMVEFRPVIKTNTEWKYLEIYQGDNRLYNLSEHDDKTGIYLEENSSIGIYVKPYTGQKVSKIVYNGTSYIDLENNDYGYYYITVPVTKSPQKIGITIEWDENYVQWNPVVESNVAYKSIRYYKLGDSGSGWIGINIGDYIPIGRMIMITIDTANTVDELVSAVSSQLTGIGINGSNGTYNITGTLTSESPQNINITIDEYIRFEDIVQPYPLFFEFTDENGNLISWGGKAKVGNTIIRTKSVSNANILAGLYNSSSYKLNGKPLEGNSYVVEKQMVFTCTTTYLLDNNEPKCILSPSRLRIPNSSYKLLGYIPDISGHGNHGKINNSAYAEGSGVNEDGSYQFDGVDDFVTIPTLSSGGKQVLMKVNSRKSDCYLYDQRNNWTQYLGIVSTKDFIAYNYSNQRGKTYIDGILNENITANDLIGITHNITVTNNRNDVKQYSPCIGTSFARNSYAQMALYDFMLFDDISTDNKIKELNEYIGIEAKVELPPYYYDAYGKTNLDEDKAIIQQRGIAVGDYDLTNTNFAYNKMSGFGGYSLGRFDKSWASSSSNNTSVIVVLRNPYDITLKKLGGNSDWEFNNTELKVISNPVSVKFKPNKNIRFTCDYHYYPVGGNSEGTPLGITSKDLIANEDTVITIPPISQENIDKYNIDINRGYYLIYFQLSPTLAVNEEVTIEMLPLYPNGLVYDGVDDYSKNENIPVLTDYTIIAKRLWINKDNPLNEQFIHKGDINTPIRESAFMLEYEIANDTYYRSSSYGGYINIERSNRPEIITYQTTESYNGISIIKGSGIDTQGLVVGAVTNNYWKGVFYKLILYPKTIPLLQINFLKNLMERDEIIDLNNPIFIQE